MLSGGNQTDGELSQKISDPLPTLQIMFKYQSKHDLNLFQFPGYNPIFDESFEFSVNLPELALVRFVVLDEMTSSVTNLSGSTPYRLSVYNQVINEWGTVALNWLCLHPVTLHVPYIVAFSVIVSSTP